MTSWLIRIGATVSGVIALMVPYTVSAKPLTSEACVKLVNEHSELLGSGVEKNMQLDPAKAAAALSAEQLASIDRFLFIEWQLRFRCPEIRLPDIEVSGPSRPQAAEFENKADSQTTSAARDTTASKNSEKSDEPAFPLPIRNPRRAVKPAG